MTVIRGPSLFWKKIFTRGKSALTESERLSLSARAEAARLDGRLSEARALNLRILEEVRNSLGEEHPATLMAMNNLAATLFGLKEYDRAQKYQEKVLKVRIATLATDDLATLQAMRNLAATYWANEKHTNARELEERALKGYIQVLGERHPLTLTAMTNLAATYWSQGRHDRALELEVKALDVQEVLLGRQHSNTTVMAWNLRTTLLETGELSAAQAILEKYLKWLSGADPNRLSGDQRTIREYLL